jgi:hypothetical protein
MYETGGMRVHYAVVRLLRVAVSATLLPVLTVSALAGAQASTQSGIAPATRPVPAPPLNPLQSLAAFAQTWAGVTAYTATVAVFDQKGTQAQNLLFDYSFRKPSNVTVHVISGPNAGVTLAWNGGATVVAWRGSGLAALFKRTLSLHDPAITTLRGSSIDQLSFGAILADAQQASGALSEGPHEVIDGVTVDVVSLITADPVTDAGLTREVLELSTTTRLPVRILGYEGTMLVRRVDFSKVTLTS